ncbi:putative 2-aminoethylphosphonate ABC transporter substrate-binding protein [Photobacterium nomapromontoriensis]|uniref:putative 2-aminoethylphosphonate ABC transporter substrate-binding protein n=1 Tax=Photobacterium nomapromontoriensis TaxID=2910237 RepID=UPI003D14F982
MKSHWLISSLLTVATLPISSTYAAEELTVYTTFEIDMLAKFKHGFENANPGIKVKWVRDSTGIMTAKLLAEKNNPKADVIWGLAGSSMALLKDEGIVKPYSPKGLNAIRGNMVDPQSNKAWFGTQAVYIALCFNDRVAKAKGLPTPNSWEDLLNPVYKGHIAMPNPASSGSGYIQVTAWLQSMGEEAAWRYMDKLNDNMAYYTHSGSKPCVQASMGEVALGISMAIRGATLKTQGAPISVIMPEGGVGWEMDAVGLVNDQSEAAKKLIDWALTTDANRLYSAFYPNVAHNAIHSSVANYPNVEGAAVNMNFSKMAENRQSVLKRWSENFDNKSESNQ